MTHAQLDRVLAILVVAMAATGLLSLQAGAPQAGWIFTLHGILGGSLLVATLVKLRRSVPKAVKARRFGRLIFGLVLGLVTIAPLTAGFAWVASGELLSLGSWTILTLHAWVGLVLVPLTVFHLLPRRWRLLRPSFRRRPARRRSASTPARPITGRQISRRALLAGVGLAFAGVGLFSATSLVDRLRGGERRFTGSRWLARGGVPPTTTFFGEGVPAIDPGAWRLTLTTADGATREWSLDQLRALGESDLVAVLDCTSGWALETDWRGVPLARLLEDAGVEVARDGAVHVAAVTGWSTDIAMRDAQHALLATACAGAPLLAGNGAPVRLVVPDARGLAWVKWVSRIEVG